MRCLALAALAGCWTTPATPTVVQPVEGAPAVRLAVARQREVAIVETGAKGLAVKYEVKVPLAIHAMYWVKDEPIVMLQSSWYDEEISPEDAKLDGTIGRITPHGFEPYDPLPEDTWAILDQQPPAAASYDLQRWDLRVTPNGEVWQGRCKKMLELEMQTCAKWAWARIDVPGPATLVEPAGVTERAPVVPPSPQVMVSFTPVAKDKDTLYRLHCESGEDKVDYPSDKDLELGLDRDAGIRWVSSTPAVFQVVHIHHGFVGSHETVTFEGCRVAREYKEATLVAGPQDMIALYNHHKLSVRWKGRELGTLPGGALVRFARSTLRP